MCCVSCLEVPSYNYDSNWLSLQVLVIFLDGFTQIMHTIEYSLGLTAGVRWLEINRRFRDQLRTNLTCSDINQKFY
jgi:hypothetical protein